MRLLETREDCDLAAHALAAEALQGLSPDPPRLQRDGNDGDLCSAPLHVEGQGLELELLPAGREPHGEVLRDPAAEDRNRTAKAEVSKQADKTLFPRSALNVSLPVKFDRSPSGRECTLIQPVSAMERERTMRNLVDAQRKVEWKQQRGRERQLLRVRKPRVMYER